MGQKPDGNQGGNRAGNRGGNRGEKRGVDLGGNDVTWRDEALRCGAWLSLGFIYFKFFYFVFY